MTWFKVDDQLPDHRKFRTLGRDRMAATGLWVTTGAWCGANLTDGFVPEEIVNRFDRSGRLAGRLVEVGLWTRDEVDGEPGYRFHDWDDHQPSKVDVEKRRRDDARRQQESRGRRRAEAAARNGDGTYSRNGHSVSHGVTPTVTHAVSHAVSHAVDNSSVTVGSRGRAHPPAGASADTRGPAIAGARAPAREGTPDPQVSDTRHGVTHAVSHPAPGPARPDPTPSTSPAAAIERPDRARDSSGGRDAADLVHAWTQDHPGVTQQRAHDLTDAVADLLDHGAEPALIPAALDAAHTDRWRNPIRGLPYAYEDARRAGQPTHATRGPSTTDQRVAAAQALKARHRDHPTGLRALPGGA